jgi:hypothetical protein
MAQPGGDPPLASPRIDYSNEFHFDGVQPVRQATIQDDSNINGNDGDAMARLVSGFVNQLTVLGRDGNIDPYTHQRPMNARDAASNIPQPQPQPQDQNLFEGMNEFIAPTLAGINHVDEEDRRRSYPLDNHYYRDGRKNEPCNG